MKYLLDTNVCIRYLSGRSPEILQKMRSTPAAEIVVCSVVKAELFYGAMKSQRPQQTLASHQQFFSQFKSLPFDDAAALIFGEVRADLARKGTPIGPYDLQIAAIALASNLTLVTHNTDEFSRVLNLQLIDWEI
jgi:tRNA(fMet)-specific endonuclease VapC